MSVSITLDGMGVHSTEMAAAAVVVVVTAAVVVTIAAAVVVTIAAAVGTIMAASRVGCRWGTNEGRQQLGKGIVMVATVPPSDITGSTSLQYRHRLTDVHSRRRC
jgi:hypothetical protein